MVNNYEQHSAEETKLDAVRTSKADVACICVCAGPLLFCTSSTSARGLFNTLNIVSQKTSCSNTFIL